MKQITLAVACLLMLGSAGSAADWGTINGQVVLKGTAPKPVLLHAKGASIKDGAVCAATDVFKDDLVVNQENNGIADVFIYLYKRPDNVHPDADKVAVDENGKPAKDQKGPKVIFDQKNCIFKPHALVLQAGQTVEVLNSDPIAHNTHTYPLKNQGQNILVAPNTAEGAGVDIPTVTRETLPIEVKCDFHPWMQAYWLILDHPYATATDKEGKFKIKNLPVGEHELRIWHGRAGYIDRKYKVTVAEGDNPALKPIEVEMSQLEDK